MKCIICLSILLHINLELSILSLKTLVIASLKVGKKKKWKEYIYISTVHIQGIKTVLRSKFSFNSAHSGHQPKNTHFIFSDKKSRVFTFSTAFSQANVTCTFYSLSFVSLLYKFLSISNYFIALFLYFNQLSVF